MAQKINSQHFRVGKRLSWGSIWAVRGSDYGVKLAASLQRYKLMNQVFDVLGLKVNQLSVLQTNKPTKTFTKTFGTDSLSSVLDISHSRQPVNLRNQKYNSNDVSSILRADRSVSEVLSISLTHLRQRKLSSVDSQLITLPVINAQMLSDYIAEQVASPDNVKSLQFKVNLLRGVAITVISLLKQLRLSQHPVISGLKVECQGKWKETSSGRKQRLLFTVGNVKAQSVDQVLSFGASTINTKFGSCCFKVWICFNQLRS